MPCVWLEGFSGLGKEPHGGGRHGLNPGGFSIYRIWTKKKFYTV
jgi:hypothetical protein